MTTMADRDRVRCGAGCRRAARRPTTYPSRPITIIVPFPAGGSTGVLARILADPMQATLGQSIIDRKRRRRRRQHRRRPGRARGAGRLHRQLGHVQTHVINGATLTLPYDVVKDFQPVALISDTPQMITTRANFPADDLKAMIAWLKANPGKGTSGAVGVGGPGDITALQFQKLTGTAFQVVPYRGGAPLLQDLVGGQIDMNFGQARPIRRRPQPPDQGHGDAGQGALVGRARDPQHGRGRRAGSLSVVLARHVAAEGHAKDVVAKLNAAVVAALADPAVRQRFKDVGQDIWPREQQTPEALAAHQKAEIDRVVADHQGRQHQGPVIKCSQEPTR